MNIKLFTITTIVLLISLFNYAQTFNRPVPNSLFPYEFNDNGFSDNQDGMILLGMFKLQSVAGVDPNYVRPYPMILDSKGYIYWYDKPQLRIATDFKFDSLSNSFSYTYVLQGELKTVRLDQNLNYIDTVSTINVQRDNHDFEFTNDSTYLLATRYIDTMDLSAYTFDGTQGSVTTPVRGYGIQELDYNNNVIFEWNSNDYIHPSETYDFYGYQQPEFDYAHGNSIEEDIDGHILVSMRHLNAIYKIHRTTGQIIWQLGGKSSSFTFTNDNGFSAQHDCRRLANGNISIYDNGNMATPAASRGVIYSLDTVNWTATKVEDIYHPTNLYTRAMGSYSVFDDFSILGYGFSLRPQPNATFFDNTNQSILAELKFPDSVMSYRVLYTNAELPPRPSITCEQTLTGWQLTAPNSSEYRWSTGENTQSITVTQTDTIQFWIPQGNGFIGSEPLIISDINAPCGHVSIEENIESKGDYYKLYNILGQPVANPIQNNIYIKVYDSGVTEKIIFINNNYK